MNDHNAACSESARLCDQLLRKLGEKVPELRRADSHRWCGFFQDGRKRFAYVTHRRKSGRIEVWCLGSVDRLLRASALPIRKRAPTTGGFGNQFLARFFLDDPHHLDAAARLLADVSYPES